MFNSILLLLVPGICLVLIGIGSSLETSNQKAIRRATARDRRLMYEARQLEYDGPAYD